MFKLNILHWFVFREETRIATCKPLPFSDKMTHKAELQVVSVEPFQGSWGPGVLGSQGMTGEFLHFHLLSAPLYSNVQDSVCCQTGQAKQNWRQQTTQQRGSFRLRQTQKFSIKLAPSSKRENKSQIIRTKHPGQNQHQSYHSLFTEQQRFRSLQPPVHHNEEEDVAGVLAKTK